MDVLADLLTRARARGALFAHSTLRGSWGLEFQDDQPLSLHAVLEDEVHVEMDGEAPLRLLPGDVLLVRADRPYVGPALRRPGATLASVAHEVGYGSEFAFANAFKREPPGRWRREQAAAV